MYKMFSLKHSLLVSKIDTDNDGFVTEKELQAWIGHVGKRYAPFS